MATHKGETMNTSADKGTKTGAKIMGWASVCKEGQYTSGFIQALLSAASEAECMQEWFEHYGFDPSTMRLAHAARKRLEERHKLHISVAITRG